MVPAVVKKFTNTSPVATSSLRRLLAFAIAYLADEMPSFALRIRQAPRQATGTYGLAWCRRSGYSIDIWVCDQNAYPRDITTVPEVPIIVRSLDEEMLVFLAHETRHVWQFFNGEVVDKWEGIDLVPHLEADAELFARDCLRAFRRAQKTN